MKPIGSRREWVVSGDVRTLFKRLRTDTDADADVGLHSVADARGRGHGHASLKARIERTR